MCQVWLWKWPDYCTNIHLCIFLWVSYGYYFKQFISAKCGGEGGSMNLKITEYDLGFESLPSSPQINVYKPI